MTDTVEIAVVSCDLPQCRCQSEERRYFIAVGWCWLEWHPGQLLCTGPALAPECDLCSLTTW